MQRKGYAGGTHTQQITFQHQRFFVIGIDLQIAGLMGMAVTNLHNQAVFSDFYDISVYESVEAIADFAKANSMPSRPNTRATRNSRLSAWVFPSGGV